MMPGNLDGIRERILQLEIELVRLKGQERIAVLEAEARRLADERRSHPTGQAGAALGPASRVGPGGPAIPAKLVLSLVEAGKVLCISSRSVCHMIQQAGLPHIRLGGGGGRVVIPVEELKSWLANRTVIIQPDGLPDVD